MMINLVNVIVMDLVNLMLVVMDLVILMVNGAGDSDGAINSARDSDD